MAQVAVCKILMFRNFGGEKIGKTKNHIFVKIWSRRRLKIFGPAEFMIKKSIFVTKILLLECKIYF